MYKLQFAKLAFVGGIFSGLLIYFSFLNFPLRGDEPHFWESALHFSRSPIPSVELLRSYVDMNTPLPFYIFGQLESFFSVGPKAGRFLNLGLALIIVLSIILQKTRFAIGSAVALMLFPYFLGTGLMMYTDMLCAFFVLLGTIAFSRAMPWWSACFFILAVWSRQYALAFPIGLFCYTLLLAWSNFNRPLKRQTVTQLVAMTVAVSSFLPLVMIWGGVAPPASVTAAGVDASFWRIFPDHPLYFMTCIGFYFVLPECLMEKGDTLRRKRYLLWGLSSLFVGSLFLLFPPIQNVEYSVQDMGFLDKIVRLFLSDFPRMLVFMFFATLACARFSEKTLMGALFWANVIIMLKAPIGWDKYALPLIVCLWYFKASQSVIVDPVKQFLSKRVT